MIHISLRSIEFRQRNDTSRRVKKLGWFSRLISAPPLLYHYPSTIYYIPVAFAIQYHNFGEYPAIIFTFQRSDVCLLNRSYTLIGNINNALMTVGIERVYFSTKNASIRWKIRQQTTSNISVRKNHFLQRDSSRSLYNFLLRKQRRIIISFTHQPTKMFTQRPWKFTPSNLHTP